MDLMKCENGHSYDPSITQECPECARLRGPTVPLEDSYFGAHLQSIYPYRDAAGGTESISIGRRWRQKPQTGRCRFPRCRGTVRPIP